MGKRGRGRPPKYESAEQIQVMIDAYFDSCKGEPLIVDGELITDKLGQPIIINCKPPTVTGLALALGFSGRQGLLNYQGKADFVDAITRAKSRVEDYCESRLFDRDGSRGAQFSLEHNFRWLHNDAGSESETGIIEIGRQADEPQPPDELVAQMMAEAVEDE